MTTYESPSEECTDLEPRTVRALTEYMTVLEDDPRVRGANDLYIVVSSSGREYLVDDHEQVCECPDYQQREIICKHLRRVAFATGKARIPGHRLGTEVDDQLGMHVSSGGPQMAVAADGGVLKDKDETGDDERPDECSCKPWMNDLPCWPCYREGYRSPKSDAE